MLKLRRSVASLPSSIDEYMGRIDLDLTSESNRDYVEVTSILKQGEYEKLININNKRLLAHCKNLRWKAIKYGWVFNYMDINIQNYNNRLEQALLFFPNKKQ